MSGNTGGGFRGMIDKIADGFVLADKVKGLFGGDASQEIKDSMEGIDPEAKIIRKTIQEKSIQLEHLRKQTHRIDSNIFKQLGAKAKIHAGLKNSNLAEITRLESEIANARLQLNQIIQDNQNKTRAENNTIVVNNEAKREETRRANDAHAHTIRMNHQELAERKNKATHEDTLRTLEAIIKTDESIIQTLENKIRLEEAQQRLDDITSKNKDPLKEVEKKISLLEKKKILNQTNLELIKTQQEIDKIKKPANTDPNKILTDDIAKKKLELEQVTIDNKLAYEKALGQNAGKPGMSAEKTQVLQNRITQLEKQIGVLNEERRKILNDRNYTKNTTTMSRLQEIETTIRQYNNNITQIIDSMT